MFFIPVVLATTFTLKVHESPAAMVAPDKTMLVSPGLAVTMPAPHPAGTVKPFGFATARPEGSGSVNATFVSEP